MITPSSLKRITLDHKNWWSLDYAPEIKEDLTELGIKFKRIGYNGEWRYLLFRARKDQRLKSQALSVLTPLEEEEELPPPEIRLPIIKEADISRLEAEVIKKRQPKLRAKISKIRELNALGKYDEAEGLFGETQECLELEICTLHIRVDYTKRDARKGHEFYLDNTSISGEFPKCMDDDEVMAILREEFIEQFEEEFGFNPFTQMDAMIEGLDRGESKSTGIFINYKHYKEMTPRRIVKEVQRTLW